MSCSRSLVREGGRSIGLVKLLVKTHLPGRNALDKRHGVDPLKFLFSDHAISVERVGTDSIRLIWQRIPSGRVVLLGITDLSQWEEMTVDEAAGSVHGFLF